MMIDVAEAWARVADAMPAWQVERIAIHEAAGRVLLEAIEADRDQPPFDRVTMDGIAIALETPEPRPSYRIAGTHPAGAPAPVLADPGDCFEVMTGAVLPEGCNCVVPVERVTIKNGLAKVSRDFEAHPGRYIHAEGTDYRAGASLLEPGQRLGTPEIAVLASVGVAKVRVNSWPRVTVISTGDELVDPGEPVKPHQIRRANDYAIAAGLRRAGVVDIKMLHLRDDPERMRATVAEALEASELLVLSGGVSKGKFDYLPGILDELGVRKVFHRVSQRPGKPMWFGTTPDGWPVFALPGNPVSALVGLTRYVIPALYLAAGAEPPVETVALAMDLAVTGDLTHFVPVDLERASSGLPMAAPRELNTSGDFFGLAGSAGIVEIPAGAGHCASGMAVRLYRW
ncbi:MAG: molybdopterin molybdotransferase MoeA [Xanthomonadales bacterium]|nr:molybdopterin molybdotransferase MoeA [Xanthomonadales bacterium]